LARIFAPAQVKFVVTGHPLFPGKFKFIDNHRIVSVQTLLSLFSWGQQPESTVQCMAKVPVRAK